MLLNNDGAVLIQDYDPSWPDAFVKTRRQSLDRCESVLEARLG
jgi:hypothetical protein